MLKFHSLEIADLTPDAEDSLRVRFRVPPELAEDYAFKSGQHVALKAPVDGKELRRTYSICAGEDEGKLEIGVRVQPGGAFSGFLAEGAKPGDRLEVMTPNGAFHVDPDPGGSGLYVAIAGGSGITPILSNIKTLLARAPETQVLLIYLNRRTRTVMFLEEIMGLKNRYPERFQVHHMLSQEEGDVEVSHGRLDAARAKDLLPRLVDVKDVSAWLLCGPGSLIDDLKSTLEALGAEPERIRFERFGLPRKAEAQAPAQPAAAGAQTAVTITIDGRKRAFTMGQGGEAVLDGAARAGLELPYSCKGGVCSTCRARVTAGKVRMDTNYALEPWELEAGFVLTCQSVPETDTLDITFDEK